MNEVNPRTLLLDKALTLVNGARNQEYDEPIDNFQRIASFWNTYLYTLGDAELQPHDIAIMNVLQKIARLMHTPDHADTWVDIAGYAACGWDCVVQESLMEDDDPEPPDAETVIPEEAQKSAKVIPLFQTEDVVLDVQERETGELGEALFFTETESESNRDQILIWLDEILFGDPPPDEVVWPGYWYVSTFFDPHYAGESATYLAMDPMTFHERYEVLGVQQTVAANADVQHLLNG